MKIITNNQTRDLISWYDLTEKERADFDYIEDGEFNGFRYKGQVYDLGEFNVVVSGDYKGALHPMALCDTENNFIGWNGYHPDSYFSGLVIKYTDNFCESVIVGRYFS